MPDTTKRKRAPGAGGARPGSGRKPKPGSITARIGLGVDADTKALYDALEEAQRRETLQYLRDRLHERLAAALIV